MRNCVQELQRHGQSVWYDNIQRDLLVSGGLQKLINLGVTGLTSNPTIFQKAIAESADYDDSIRELIREGKSSSEIYESLAIEDIRAAADLLLPIYEESNGDDGYASLEVNPHLANDTESTIAEANKLFTNLDRPNVMIKVPATPEGIPAIHRLVGQGININVTLTFSLDAYRDVRQAYIAGLEDLAWSGRDVRSVASVASFFVSRVDTAVDALIKINESAIKQVSTELLGKAAIANAKLAYRDFQKDFCGQRFASLKTKGARVQRPLWASTSTKNPDYRDVMYPESLIGANTVDTLPEATLMAFIDHGKVSNSINQGLEEAEAVFDSLEHSGVSIEQVTTKLLSDGLKIFSDSYDQLISDIEEKRTILQSQE